MNPVTLFLIILFVVVLFVIILCACGTRCRRKKPCIPVVDPCCRRSRAHALRTQTTSTVIPAVPILSSGPIDISFTSPTANNYVEIPRDDHYRVTYNLQLAWTQEAGASVAIHVIYPDSTPAADISGSQIQAYNVIATTENLSQSFVSYFPKGAQLYLRAQATSDASVSVPASDSTTLLVPTTLASIYATSS